MMCNEETHVTSYDWNNNPTFSTFTCVSSNTVNTTTNSVEAFPPGHLTSYLYSCIDNLEC